MEVYLWSQVRQLLKLTNVKKIKINVMKTYRESDFEFWTLLRAGKPRSIIKLRLYYFESRLKLTKQVLWDVILCSRIQVYWDYKKMVF
jgi:hypothetical protein